MFAVMSMHTRYIHQVNFFLFVKFRCPEHMVAPSFFQKEFLSFFFVAEGSIGVCTKKTLPFFPLFLKGEKLCNLNQSANGSAIPIFQ